MATTDRRGVSVDAAGTAIAGNPNPGLAIKAPCRVATTANILLSGLQTIDGVALAAGDRVLVKNQTDPTLNGLYNASTGVWKRTIDAAGNSDFANGTVVYVALGALNADQSYMLTTPDPVRIGTSNITFLFLASSGVPPTLNINTTAPLAGGGNLSADKTLSLTINGSLQVVSGALAVAPLAGVSKKFVSSFAATGVPQLTQPAFTDLSGSAIVAQGGTGQTTLTVHAVLLGAGTSGVAAATIGTAGALLIDQGAGADPAFTAMSGDATISSAGAITIAKVHGVSYGAAPSTNTVPVVTGANTVTYETVPIAAGGTNAATQQAALNNIAPTPTRAGDIIYYNGSNWVALPGNNSGTQILQMSSAGVPSWFDPAPITNSLGANVVLNNTGTYFDGPSVAQGSTGTWFVTGTVTLRDTSAAATFNVKLWDGATVIASAVSITTAINVATTVSLSGFLASPAGNLRISVNDSSTTSGLIQFNASGLGKDSTITAFRIK